MKNLLLYGLLVFLLCTDGKQVEAAEFCSEEFHQVTLYNRETITTQNHPSNYEDKKSCYIFRFTDKPHMKIVFSHIDLEDCCDYVKIYDQWTESDLGEPIYSTRYQDKVKKITEGEEIIVGDRVLFQFFSDHSFTKSGVQLTIEPYGTWRPEPSFEFCRSTETKGLIDGIEYFKSPNYPEDYEPNMDCYLSRRTTSSHMKIIFYHLDLEFAHDILEIYAKSSKDAIEDGEEPIYTSEAYRRNKITIDEEIIVGNEVTFRFYSDNSIQYSGLEFSIEPLLNEPYEPSFEFCSSTETKGLIDGIEYITSPNYPEQYEPNMDCYLSRRTTSSYLKIIFYYLDLEFAFDILEIYEKSSKDAIEDGEEPIYNSGGAVGKMFTIHDMIIVGNEVTFHLVSNDFSQYSGLMFSIEPYDIPEPIFEFCSSTEDNVRLDGIEYIKLSKQYEAHSNCYLSRSSTTSSHMKIIFYQLDHGSRWVTRTFQSYYDTLEIYEKSSKDAIEDGEEAIYSSNAYYGKEIIKIGEEIIVGNEVTFRLHSDESERVSRLMFSIEPYGLDVSLGNPVQAQVDIPDMFNLPLLTEVLENVYDVLAPVIHLSSVVSMLNNKNQNFAVHQTEDREMTLELTIRADTIYVDEDHLNFRGLKRLKILGRRLVGNDATLLLSAPDVCERIDSGGNCIYNEKAALMEDGADGKSGVDTPVTNIFVYQIEGNIKILFEASDGIQGEEGGDGRPGRKMAPPPDVIPNPLMCNQSILTANWVYKGLSGRVGEVGKDGRRGGKGGDGGSISDITIKITKLSTGSIQIHQLPGKGEQPGNYGLGGSGGPVGVGGCGVRCDHLTTTNTIRSVSDCSTDVRGDKAMYDAQYGHDGGYWYRGVYGHDGTITHPTSNIGASLRDEFADQEKMLGWIIRGGELMFQRKRSSQAADVFDFLLSVLEPDHKKYKEVARRRRVIASGFDFHVSDERYAPDLGWKYFKDRTDELIHAGRALEDDYNDVKRYLKNLEQESTKSRTNQKLVISAIRNNAIVTIEAGKKKLNFEKDKLKSTKHELNDQKDYMLKALRVLEGSLESEQSEMIQLLPKAMHEAQGKMDAGKVKRYVKIGTDLLIGLAAIVSGVASGIVTGGGTAAVGVSASLVVGGISEIAKGTVEITKGSNMCKIPQLREATQSVEGKVRFGFEYSRMKPEDLDFSTANVSMIPEIMKSKLSKNKAALISEFKCLFKWGDGENANKLESVLNSYFYRADQRASLIWKVVDIDIKLKEIGHNLKNLEEAEKSYNGILSQSEQSQYEQKSLPINIKTLFLERIFKVLQQKETAIMKLLYELSKSYEFISLWKFHTLEKYNEIMNNMAMQTHMDTYDGMLHLEDIEQSLENERDDFLQSIRGYTGQNSHVYIHYSEFNSVTSPHIINDLHTNGAFAIRIELKPGDVQTNGCDKCYNQRLLGVYVELIGEQDDLVNKIIYVEVAHMGDNHFLIPDHDGTDKVILLEQTPFKNGGKMLNFDSRRLFSSKNDPLLEDKLSEETYTFCENDQDSENFFTEKPCKSPYATFSIKVPRGPDLPCVKSENEWPSGENCRDLDFTKFTSVRFYQKIRSWTSYPSQS